ncbi:hypothetical protein N2152v2_000728 [Parachlorella kessleri]
MGTDLGNALNGLYGGDFDYTFTEAELHDVLGYMEAQQSGGLVEPLPFYSTALQFQPHNTSSQQVGIAESLVPLKPEMFDVVDLGPMPPCPPVSSAMVPSAIATPPQQPQLNGGNYHPPPQQQQQQVSGTAYQQPPGMGQTGSSSSTGGGGSASVPHGGVVGVPSGADLAASMSGGSQPGPQLPPPSQLPPPQPHTYQQYHPPPAVVRQAAPPVRKDGKPHVSHSTVEKQRRDRINSLIDELRELVPPSRADAASAAHPPDPHDTKRPKHVVLSDTIAMVKELQERLAMSETQLAQLREHEEHCPFHEHEEHQAALKAATGDRENGGGHENSSGSRGSHPELPHAPVGHPPVAEPTVLVEEGEAGSMYVKASACSQNLSSLLLISCKDRHGLLADLVRALKAVPVEIVTAAITTTPEGGVYDVFQVIPDPDGPNFSREEVAARLQQVLAEQHTGDKRRRDSL